MKRAIGLAFAVMSVACGGNGGGGGTGGGSTPQTCTQKYSCIGGSCQCTEGPKNGSSCCDPSDSSCTTNVCDTFCRYCQ